MFSPVLYCEIYPVGLLRAPYHGYFSPPSANPVPLGHFCLLYPPIGGRRFGMGGVNGYVNHSREAGQRITERARLEELLNKANSSALRKPLFPIRIQHQRVSNGRRLNLSAFSHKCSYGLAVHFRRKTEVFLNLTA